MFVFSIAITLNSLFTALCNENSKQLPNFTRKIVGGHDCSTEKYPFVVSLRAASNLEHFCGGSLIREDWVLTVAHCMTTRDPLYYVVVAGTSELHMDGIQRATVDAIFVHPRFFPADKEYDIALMHLNKPFNLSVANVGVIALPTSRMKGDLKDQCDQAMVMGWGHQDQWHPKEKPIDYRFRPILQCVLLPILEDQQCTDLVERPLTNNVVCAYYENGGRDACQGDSGGPLFCNDTLFGLVSSGYGCALPERPGFYTRVDRYLDFIENSTTAYRHSPVKRMNSSAFSKTKLIRNPRFYSIFIVLILFCSFK